MKTEVLPLIVGLSLCSASAVLLYIWYKTKDQDITDSPNVSPAKLKRETKVECVIPNNIVPLVVGRNGANLKSIEQKTKTIIRFREKDENNQICEISGFIENVQIAVDLVKHEASPPPNITVEMFVPQNSCGKIIGRCGEALQEICRKSMAKVHVDAGDRNDGVTRRILITGKKAHVNIAKVLIEEKIEKYENELKYESELRREPRGSSKSSLDDSKSTSSDDSVIPAVAVQSEKLNLIKTDGQLDVYISAIASPSRFWLQLVGPQSAKLDTLVETMTDYYNVVENQKMHRIADPYLGQIVTAMFKYDGKWYRAEIVGILPNDFNPRDVLLDLYFVDFGDSEYVAPHEVFELRTDFLTLRFQAIECFLANVKPSNKENKDLWGSEAISRFEDLTHVAKWTKIVASVVTTKERNLNELTKKEGSPIPGVELFDTIDGIEKNIGHELIREGYALQDLPENRGSPPSILNTSQENNLPSLSSSSSSSNTNGINENNNATNHITTTDDNNSAILSSLEPSKSNNYALDNEHDKFTSICENTTNENCENIKIDNRNQNNSFIDAERFNGNTSDNHRTATTDNRNDTTNNLLSGH